MRRVSRERKVKTVKRKNREREERWTGKRKYKKGKRRELTWMSKKREMKGEN